MSGSIHEHHRERLRERYLAQGLDGFTDHEILEMLLGYTILQKDTNPIAHELINRFGSLRNVFETPPELLTQVAQLGDGSAFFLNLLPDITRRYYEQLTVEHMRFLDADEVVDFFAARFCGRKEECLYAAFLDEHRRLIDCTLQYVGSVSAVEIHAPKILRTAKALDCRHIVISHNHFRDSDPSEHDVSATARIYEALALEGIELVDHYVICGNEGTSMKESGHFKKALDELGLK